MKYTEHGFALLFMFAITTALIIWDIKPFIMIPLIGALPVLFIGWYLDITFGD